MQILLRLGPYNGPYMASVDVMCGIVLNCQELNCRARDNLGFLLWAAVQLGRGARALQLGAGGARPVLQLVSRWP